MNPSDFSKIAREYESISLVQNSAGKVLLSLLQIQENERVLDLGCGPGHLTSCIQAMTKGGVIGVDPSEGMINQAQGKYSGVDFAISSAETLQYCDEFDVIFSNSAFQWVQNWRLAIRNCYKALLGGGRIGVQAPACNVYSPTFVKAIEDVAVNPETRNIYRHFKSPWFFLETAEEYKSIFEKERFNVVFSRIEKIITPYPYEKVYEIFRSGAAAGYLNRDYYDIPIDEKYQADFLNIVRNSFIGQAKNNVVPLIFNRIFLVAEK